jgi:uncharacterized protein
VKSVLIGLGIGVVAGITSGLLGVGGGIVIVPLLVAFAALSQHQANATSLAAIVPIAAAAATRFAVDGRIAWTLAGLLVVGSLAGAPLGARLMSRSSPGLLKAMFGTLMIAVSLQLLLT